MRMSYADNAQRSSKATAAFWATAESVLLKGIVTLLRCFLFHFTQPSPPELLSHRGKMLPRKWSSVINRINIVA